MEYDHADISLLELRLNESNQKLEIRTVKTDIVFGPQKNPEEYYHYYPCYIGVGKKSNNIVTCGFIETDDGTIENPLYDLYTTYMTHKWFDAPYRWSEAEPFARFSTNDLADEKCEMNTGFLPYGFGAKEDIAHPRGLASGVYIEGKGTFVVGTEYIHGDINKKQMRVAFNPEVGVEYCWT